jgi:hypothetical protein
LVQFLDWLQTVCHTYSQQKIVHSPFFKRMIERWSERSKLASAKYKWLRNQFKLTTRTSWFILTKYTSHVNMLTDCVWAQPNRSWWRKNNGQIVVCIYESCCFCSAIIWCLVMFGIRIFVGNREHIRPTTWYNWFKILSLVTVFKIIQKENNLQDTTQLGYIYIQTNKCTKNIMRVKPTACCYPCPTDRRNACRFMSSSSPSLSPTISPPC